MIILNYAHPITASQQEQVVKLTERTIEKIIDIPSQINQQEPFTPQSPIS